MVKLYLMIGCLVAALVAGWALSSKRNAEWRVVTKINERTEKTVGKAKAAARAARTGGDSAKRVRDSWCRDC